MSTANLFINGEWKSALDGGTREILNPANNQAIATVADASVRDPEVAIAAARKAFDDGAWPRMRAGERASYLFKLADAIDGRAEEFAVLETRNNGKPLREAKYDVADAANCFRYYAGLITKPQGQTFEVPDPNITTMVVREPIGVCGQIIPWNYPLLMAAWKLAPGLAAGNCCILKPAEATPLTAIKLFELIAHVGFPPGSAQLVLGPGPTVGHALAASPLVDKIAFTGGTATGRKIQEAATGNLKKTTLELGGKSPNIVFADAPCSEFTPARARCAAPVRACCCKNRSPTASCRAWPKQPTKLSWATDWIPRRRWDHSSAAATWSACWATSKPAKPRELQSSAAASASPMPGCGMATSLPRLSSQKLTPKCALCAKKSLDPS